MNDSHDQLNDYLDYLAGRRKSPPKLSAEDHDVLKAMRLLRHAHPLTERPEFMQRLQQNPQSPKRLKTRSERGSRTWSWWTIRLVPAVAVATALILIVRLPASKVKQLSSDLNLLHRITTQQTAAATVTLTATKSDSSGVDATTAFTLAATSGSLDLATVKQHFTFTPTIDFTVKTSGDNTFTITPTKPLDSGVVYTASFGGAVATATSTEPRTYSWAYQVRQTFMIVGTYPRDQVTNFPLYSGLEVTFSQAGVSAKDFQQHFQISPNVPVKFEVHGRTLVAVPQQPLQEQTLYTMALTAGLAPTGATDTIADTLVIHFETAAKNQASNGYQLQPSTPFATIAPKSPMVLSVNVLHDPTKAKLDYHIDVFKYAGMDDFQQAVTEHLSNVPSWALYAASRVHYSSTGLTKVASVSGQLQADAITWPNDLPEGAYLAIMDSDPVTELPFLVTPVGAYAITSETQSLVWLTDLNSKHPLANATVSLPDQTAVTTTTQGFTQFDTPATLLTDKASPVLLPVKAGDHQTFVLLERDPYQYFGRSFGPYGQTDDRYWTYLSIDRPIYQPNDTVYFWGIAKPRQPGAPVPQVSARLISTSYTEASSIETEVDHVDLTLSDTGTFIGHLQLKNLSLNNGKDLRIMVGDEVIASRSLDVEAYRKPPYQLTLTPDRSAVFDGQAVKFTVQASFFDGTPVPNLDVALNVNGSSRTLTTNAQGQVTTSQTMASYGTSVSVNPVGENTSNIFADAFIQVYPGSYDLSTTVKATPSSATVNGLLRTIDLSKYSNTDATKAVTDPVAGATISGKLYHTTYEQQKSGQHYDFLSKQVIPTYTYAQHDETTESFTVTTDANGQFSKTWALNVNDGYRVEWSVQDPQHRTITRTDYLWSYVGQPTSGHTLIDPNVADQNVGAKYGVGQSASAKVQTAGGQAPEAGLQYLFLSSEAGLRQAAVSTNPSYAFTFSEADVPTLHVRAVIFTGASFEELNDVTYTFDQSTRKLNLTLTTDQPSYQPGQLVKLHVRVTDQSGQGVVAKVNLRAIDQALSNLGYGNDSDPLSAVYRYVGDGIFGTYASHRAFDLAQGAEGGGGGGDRVSFKDNALYTEVTTGSDGQGDATFTAPDNLTSWNVTAQAITDSLQAGVTSRLVPVSLPIFVTADVPTTVLTKDKPSIPVTVYGQQVSVHDTASVTMSIVDRAGTDVTKSGHPFSAIDFPLPELPVGQYQVRFKATAKGQSDSLVLPINVVTSTLRHNLTSVAILEAGDKPQLSSDGDTQVVLGNANRLLAYTTLQNVLWAPHQRLDEGVAATIANRRLNDDFKETTWQSAFDPNAYVTNTGVALYPFGSDDLEYAALAAGDPAMAPVSGQLLGWFTNVLNNRDSNTDQISYALLGLANLGQPVLPDIHAWLAVPDLPDHERLTLALALDALGAREEVRPIVSYLNQRYGHTQAPYFWLTLGQSNDEHLVATARYAIIATDVGESSGFGALRYSIAHQPKDTTTSLEAALASERLLAAASPTVSVTYQLHGQSVTKSLKDTETFSLIISAADAKQFAITNHTGSAGVTTTYDVPTDQAITPDPALSISRRYLVNGKNSTTFKRGDVVRVEITWSAKAGAPGTWYGITDTLPTGLRPLSEAYLYTLGYDQKRAFPMALDDRRVVLYAGERSFYYLTQAVIPGTAVAEPPLLQAFDAPGSLTLGQSSQGITIQ